MQKLLKINNIHDLKEAKRKNTYIYKEVGTTHLIIFANKSGKAVVFEVRRGEGIEAIEAIEDKFEGKIEQYEENDNFAKGVIFSDRGTIQFNNCKYN